eukprot:1202729-Karenia_brevis.AAC.1
MLLHDLRVLHQRVPQLSELSDPAVDPAAWIHLMTQHPAEWKQLVNLYFTVDDDVSETNLQIDQDVAYECEVCHKLFATSKARDSHMRAAHKQFNPVFSKIGDTSICYACHVDFCSRTRLLCHLGEKRLRAKSKKKTCAQIILEGNLPDLESE